MKHSVAIKFIAILLCALSLVSIIASGFGILYMENLNLYNTSLEEMKAQQAESVALNLALYSAQVHAIQSLSNCPPEIQEDVMATHNYYLENYLFGDYAVEIFQNGELVYTYHEAAQLGDYNTFEYTLNPTYPIVTYQYRHSDIWSEPEVTEAPLQTLPPEHPALRRRYARFSTGTHLRCGRCRRIFYRRHCHLTRGSIL